MVKIGPCWSVLVKCWPTLNETWTLGSRSNFGTTLGATVGHFRSSPGSAGAMACGQLLFRNFRVTQSLSQSRPLQGRLHHNTWGISRNPTISANPGSATTTSVMARHSHETKFRRNPCKEGPFRDASGLACSHVCTIGVDFGEICATIDQSWPVSVKSGRAKFGSTSNQMAEMGWIGASFVPEIGMEPALGAMFGISLSKSRWQGIFWGVRLQISRRQPQTPCSLGVHSCKHVECVPP